jgi:hypothetical protein
MPMLKFEYSGLIPIENPKIEEIINGLKDLGNTIDAFAILSKSELTYIQVSGTPKTGFMVEYQIDNIENHFRAKNENISIEDCIKCFVTYFQNDDSWKNMFEWEREDLKKNSGCLSIFPLFAALIYFAKVALTKSL